MSKNFDVKIPQAAPSDFPMSELEVGDVAIVTEAPPSCVPNGSLVVKAATEYTYPGLGLYTRSQSESFLKFRVRRLKPGETVTITGK